MDFIKGESLSEKTSISQPTTEQLADFLRKCGRMAQLTKEEGEVVIPDLLGGVKHMGDCFKNFVVQEKTGNLFFVDIYPLVILKGRAIRKYNDNLMKAAKRLNNSQVESATLFLTNSMK